MTSIFRLYILEAVQSIGGLGKLELTEFRSIFAMYTALYCSTHPVAAGELMCSSALAKQAKIHAARQAAAASVYINGAIRRAIIKTLASSINYFIKQHG